MMDGVPNRGLEPKYTLVTDAVGITGNKVDICSDGGDQDDTKPNHDTLAT
jgi:hypothetical protein